MKERSHDKSFYPVVGSDVGSKLSSPFLPNLPYLREMQVRLPAEPKIADMIVRTLFDHSWLIRGDY